MLNLQLQLLIIALITAIACALPGVFLVLRGVALMSDAISHAILPGIVIMFLLVQNLESPLLIAGACMAGLVTVMLTEWIIGTHKIAKDAAIGLVFPLFFSVGILLISRYTYNVHVDTDMVLLGELAFAPFDRFVLWGIDLGACALWVMATVALLNCFFVGIFYKELKLTTFDPMLAQMLGISPSNMHYLLMALTSLTAVSAFNVVGSIVVVALMLTPAATAYLLTEQVGTMITTSIAIAMLSALGGYNLACLLDASIAGSIATAGGIIFLCVLIAAPYKGLCSRYFYAQKMLTKLNKTILCTHLKYHCCSSIFDVANHLGWTPKATAIIARQAYGAGLVVMRNNLIKLTSQGEDLFVMRDN